VIGVSYLLISFLPFSKKGKKKQRSLTFIPAKRRGAAAPLSPLPPVAPMPSDATYSIEALTEKVRASLTYLAHPRNPAWRDGNINAFASLSSSHFRLSSPTARYLDPEPALKP
jgi:hypothetical protein